MGGGCVRLSLDVSVGLIVLLCFYFLIFITRLLIDWLVMLWGGVGFVGWVDCCVVCGYVIYLGFVRIITWLFWSWCL